MSVTRIVRLSYLLPALALLSGCGGGSSVPPQAAAAGPGISDAPVLPQANHYGNDAYIVTAQLYGNDATVYTRSGYTLTYKETLSQGILAPQGAVTTPNDYLYVANGGRSNVLVYKVSKKNFPTYPTDTLDDYGQIPDDVSATANRNLVAVSNFSTTSGGAGSVSVYVGRESEPSQVLTYGTDTLQGEGVAIDHQGNCFWSFNDPNTNSGSVVEFAGCSGNGTAIVSGLSNAQGIVFDQSGDLYYVDQAYGIYKCVKTSKCALWAANQTNGFGLPTTLNFDYKEKSLWLADASGYMWAISIKGNCHDKTSTCLHKYTSQDGDPFGIAPIRGD